MDITIFYDNDCLNKNKLRRTWVQKNLPIFYKSVNEFECLNSQSSLRFSQIMYNYINGISKVPVCKHCSIKEQRFIGFSSGYNDFCSKKCSSKDSLDFAIKKRKENTLKKYGVSHTSKLKSVKEKQKQTNIEKYGFVSPTLNKDVRKKQLNTMLENHGVLYPGESSSIFEKTLETRFEKYKSNVLELYNDLNITNIEKEGELDILCDVCNKDYKIKTTLLRLRHIRYKVVPCLNCNPLSSYKYTTQNEIHEIVSKYFNVELGNRKILNGKELDIYIESEKIAIEFNGVYWHSNLFKDKKYHLNKKEQCEELDINLIHIWEDDWIYKKEIVISRLMNVLNLTESKIWARKCEIRKVESKESNLFLDKNHLQGNVNSYHKFGLYYNNELVSLMTFGKLRISNGTKNKDNIYELYRFVSKIGVNVVGGFSKLLKYFEVNFCPSEIVTYANRDWSMSDNVYIKNGFIFDHNTPVNYWYYDKYLKKHHRFKFRKDVLVSQGHDINKTESEIMLDLGYLKVYDCGNKKYSKTYTK